MTGLDFSPYSSLSREKILHQVRSQMSQRRFDHCLRVEKKIMELATLYGVDVIKASLAALIHDYAKERPLEELQELNSLGFETISTVISITASINSRWFKSPVILFATVNDTVSIIEIKITTKTVYQRVTFTVIGKSPQILFNLFFKTQLFLSFQKIPNN